MRSSLVAHSLINKLFFFLTVSVLIASCSLTNSFTGRRYTKGIFIEKQAALDKTEKRKTEKIAAKSVDKLVVASNDTSIISAPPISEHSQALIPANDSVIQKTNLIAVEKENAQEVKTKETYVTKVQKKVKQYHQKKFRSQKQKNLFLIGLILFIVGGLAAFFGRVLMYNTATLSQFFLCVLLFYLGSLAVIAGAFCLLIFLFIGLGNVIADRPTKEERQKRKELKTAKPPKPKASQERKILWCLFGINCLLLLFWVFLVLFVLNWFGFLYSTIPIILIGLISVFIFLKACKKQKNGDFEEYEFHLIKKAFIFSLIPSIALLLIFLYFLMFT